MAKIYEYGGEQFKLERSYLPTYECADTKESRVIAYIALPGRTTTLMEESDILWWAKVHTELDWWTDGNEYYKVYRVYVKEQYLYHITEELLPINGFYLHRNLYTLHHQRTNNALTVKILK